MTCDLKKVVHEQAIEKSLIPVLHRLQNLPKISIVDCYGGEKMCHLPLSDIIRVDSTLYDLIVRLLVK